VQFTRFAAISNPDFGFDSPCFVHDPSAMPEMQEAFFQLAMGKVGEWGRVKSW